MKNIIEDTIELNSPIQNVWQALTEYKEFGEWFGVKLEGAFGVGKIVKGKITHPDYQHIQFEISVKKMEPEKSFSYTWHPFADDPKVDYSKEIPTLVEFILEKTDRGTQLTVVESGFDHLFADRKEKAYQMHVEGWHDQLISIEKYLQGKH